MGSNSLVGQGGDEQSAATAAATADLSRRLESVNARLDKSQKQLALAKEKESYMPSRQPEAVSSKTGSRPGHVEPPVDDIALDNIAEVNLP